jgi:hypothetical protein
MGADPEPDEIPVRLDGESAIPATDRDGTVAADLFEMKRWMTRVLLEQREVRIGEATDSFGQLARGFPERPPSEMVHNRRARPALSSTLPISGCEAESVGESLQEGGWNFHDFPIKPGHG